MPETLTIADVAGDGYSIEGGDTDSWGACVSIAYTGAGVPPQDMLLNRAKVESLRDWLNQWIAEQGQEAGEEADDGRVS